MKEASLVLEDLEFCYEGTPILKNASAQLFHGEFVCIIGPNGGGKTTLLKLLMGFLSPTRGKIAVLGGQPKNCREQISYVPQTNLSDRDFPISALEVVLGGRLHLHPWYRRLTDRDRRCAVEMLEKLGMADFCNKPFGKLSGGQAKRVLIARALVAEPQLLLLDEPTAMVDSATESVIYGMIEEMRGKMTVLMVTHQLQGILHRADKVLLVQGTVQTLKPEQVCGHFAMGVYHQPLAFPEERP